MTNLYRSASLDRVLTETDFRHKVAADQCKCNGRGYPYCCTAHYYAQRYWPYYLDHRVADHGYPHSCYLGCCPPAPLSYPYDLWPRYHAEYLRGYDYGLRKFGCACPSGSHSCRRRPHHHCGVCCGGNRKLRSPPSHCCCHGCRV